MTSSNNLRTTRVSALGGHLWPRACVKPLSQLGAEMRPLLPQGGPLTLWKDLVSVSATAPPFPALWSLRAPRPRHWTTRNVTGLAIEERRWKYQSPCLCGTNTALRLHRLRFESQLTPSSCMTLSLGLSQPLVLNSEVETIKLTSVGLLGALNHASLLQAL